LLKKVDPANSIPRDLSLQGNREYLADKSASLINNRDTELRKSKDRETILKGLEDDKKSKTISLILNV
jgi:hypothetical protein